MLRRAFHTALFALPLWLAGCSSEPTALQETRFMMGTIVTFTVVGTKREAANDAIREAANAMQQLADRLTIYGEGDNPVKQFNRQPAGEAAPLPADIAALLAQSLEIRQQSGGAFDPALGALDLLWGFSATEAPTAPPDATAIHRIVAARPATCIERQPDGQWLRRSTLCQLDFGAIAKGYIVDHGMSVLRQHGIQEAMINAGGDIRSIGRHGERPWHIGIRHPRDKERIIAALEVSDDITIVTSGDYERFFIAQGRRYHHILDPASGWPATASISSTVIGHDAAAADAWSTALFVMGPKGLPLVEQHGMDGLVIDAAGKIHMTDGMRSRLRLNDEPLMLRSGAPNKPGIHRED